MNKLTTQARRTMVITGLIALGLLTSAARADRFVETILSAGDADQGNIAVNNPWSSNPRNDDGTNGTLYIGNLGRSNNRYPTDGKGLVRFDIPSLEVDQELTAAVLRLRVQQVASTTAPPSIFVYYAGNDGWDETIVYDDTTYGTGSIDLGVSGSAIAYFRAIDGTTVLPAIGRLYTANAGDPIDPTNIYGRNIWYEYDVSSLLNLTGEGPGNTISFFVDYSHGGQRAAYFYGTSGGADSYPQLALTTFIPEPATFALLGLGILPLVSRRRRSS
ncbi:MAG: DNRLRE domain-containing protein [Candidatus Pacebacteria bacterium]|nr:DNRLRE domain-containing protein [Candidatus Paceibacterota bacterium]